MDWYMKGVLTVIAGALVALAVEHGSTPAQAQTFSGPGCGTTAASACYVRTAPNVRLDVHGS